MNTNIIKDSEKRNRLRYITYMVGFTHRQSVLGSTQSVQYLLSKWRHEMRLYHGSYYELLKTELKHPKGKRNNNN